MTQELKPVDLLGNEIHVGDKVKFMQIKYRGFMRGIVKSMAPTSALITHDKTNTCQTESRQCYNQMISITAYDQQQERIRQLEAERDAAIEDIPVCAATCVHSDGGVYCNKYEYSCFMASRHCWQWRGRKEQNDGQIN